MEILIIIIVVCWLINQSQGKTYKDTRDPNSFDVFGP